MPFKSKAQQRYMYAKHPEIAQEFADKTPDMADLPEKVDNTAGMSPTAKAARMGALKRIGTTMKLKGLKK